MIAEGSQRSAVVAAGGGLLAWAAALLSFL
jgi:hypothetical protein